MKVSFAFSPCPNDTFMFEAIVNNRIDTEGLEFEIFLADVEELNKSAFKNRFDISKLSFNAFTQRTNDYQLLNSGSALGHKCGPLLIGKAPTEMDAVNQLNIAVPGENTTANFLMHYAFPEAVNKRNYLFSEIESAVLSGEVDAGVIIHENRFTYEEKGLHKIVDLGEYWEEKTGSPIPLGGIVCRRSFDLETKQKIDRVIAKSVQFAFDHPEIGMDYIRQHAQEMSDLVMRSHINLYVNEYSKNLGPNGKQSIEFLFSNHPKVKNVNRPIFIPKDEAFLEEKYWTGLYTDDQFGWDVGYITPPLKDYIDQLDNKEVRILIPGGGNSYEAEYLHKNGFRNVHVVDLSSVPLKNIKKRCPDFDEKHLIQGDFFNYEGQYDLILEQTFFCALHPSLRQQYVEKMSTLLAPKGILAGLLFNVHFPKDGPPFGGSKDEYMKLIAKELDLLYMIDCKSSIPQRSGSELFFEAQKRVN